MSVIYRDMSIAVEWFVYIMMRDIFIDFIIYRILRIIHTMLATSSSIEQ